MYGGADVKAHGPKSKNVDAKYYHTTEPTCGENAARVKVQYPKVFMLYFSRARLLH